MLLCSACLFSVFAFLYRQMEAAPSSPIAAPPAAQPAIPEPEEAADSEVGDDNEQVPENPAERHTVDYYMPRQYDLTEDRPPCRGCLEGRLHCDVRPH